MSDLNEEYIKNRDERYFKTREQTQAHQVETGNAFINHLLAVSAGTLALSVTNLDKIAPHGISPESKWILIVAWGSLLFSILLTVGCVGFGSLSFIRGIEQLDNIQEHWIQTISKNYPQGEKIPESKNRNLWPLLSQISGFMAVGFLAVGLGFLGWFSILNLS